MQLSRIDRIHSELHQEIIRRQIPPGARLSENQLSKRWGVSRTPFREVLRRLESEDLVTFHRFKGFVVNQITLEDVDQLYIIRITLEGLAGRLATKDIAENPNKLKFLGKLCGDMKRLCRQGEVEAYVRKNNEFHSLIWQSCGNRWLIKILEKLTTQVNRFIVTALYVPHRMDKSIQEHLEIYRNLKRGNEKGVEKAIQNNHRRAFEDLRKEFVKSG
jgi:DNA-binding GntR family transcriptional regulator